MTAEVTPTTEPARPATTDPTTADKPGSARPKPAVKTGEPSAETGEPSARTEEPTAETDERSIKTDEPTTKASARSDEPTAKSGETSTRTDEPPSKTDKLTAKTDESSTKTVEPPAKAEPPADPFTAFAPQPPSQPGRLRRAAGAIGAALAHEWSLAGLGAILLAVVMTWPTLRYPRHTIPQDIRDPALQAWQMAWSGHILTSDPSQLWHSNAFYPERYTFAFSDTLLGYAPAGMIGEGVGAALLRYNIIYVLAYALAFFGAYALVRQLGSGRTGAAVAGAAFAYAPWRLAQAGHLHVLSTGGIALALAMLARGHGWSLRHGFRPERRHAGWALAGWLVAAWQISLGFGIGLPFAYALAVIVVVAAATRWIRRTWSRARRRPPGARLYGGRLFVADLIGGLAFAATGVLLALPYFRVADLHPYARRTVDDLKLFSAPFNGFLTAPAESRLWGGLHADARAALPWHPEMTLLPGFALYGLAIAGMVFSIWTVRQRLLLLIGVVVTIVLAMGTRFFGGTLTYLPLYETLPGWNGLRTPGRLVLWTTLLLGVLAAGAVGAFVERARESRATRSPYGLGFWLRFASLIPLVLVLAEGLNRTPHPVVPPGPQALRSAQQPILVLPSDEQTDNDVMLWSTDGFPLIVNGNSGFIPHRLAELRQVTKNFPDQASVDQLRGLGVRTVIVLRVRPDGSRWEPMPGGTPVELLGIEREDTEDAVVYRLTPN